MQILTPNQQKVYDYIVERLDEGLPPTVREICSKTGIRSTSTVFAVLNALEEKGYITRSGNSSRSIRVNAASTAVNVPLVGVVTAGVPILAIQNIEEYLPLPSSISRGRELFALHVKGMSMMNAGILDGDIVYAEKVSSALDGDIVVALIDDEATVKRLIHSSDGKAMLMPENDAFSPIIPDELVILGKVIASFRQY